MFKLISITPSSVRASTDAYCMGVVVGGMYWICLKRVVGSLVSFWKAFQNLNNESSPEQGNLRQCHVSVPREFISVILYFG